MGYDTMIMETIAVIDTLDRSISTTNLRYRKCISSSRVKVVWCLHQKVTERPMSLNTQVGHQNYRSDCYQRMEFSTQAELYRLIVLNAMIHCSVSILPSVPHPRRRLIHPSVIDDITTQHRRTSLSPAKVRCWIAPKVSTVHENAPREWIPPSSRSCATLRRSYECIEAQKLLPLREKPFFPMGVWFVAWNCGIRSHSGVC